MALLLKSLQIKRCFTLNRFIQQHYYGKYCAEKNLKKCYSVLGLPENSDQKKIRDAYINLSKKYHPDSKSADADPVKFQEIDKAFRILINKTCRANWGIEEIEVDDLTDEFIIKHCTPQHRQYLSYDGMGYGTLSEREKQYSKIRAIQAADRILEHRIKKGTAGDKAILDKKKHTHTIKTKYGFDRIVEDLIQESMKKGEFKNLKGSGKPLPCLTCNPYVDFVTHKLNQVLIDNGFTPEWIMLQKDIRDEKKLLKRNLYKARSNLGEYPLNDREAFRWQKVVEKYTKDAVEINKKIEKYNLVVPLIQTQIVLISIQKEADKILKYGQTSHDIALMYKTEKIEGAANMFSFIESLIIKRRNH